MMTKLLDKYKKIQTEQSEIRQRLGEIGLLPAAERTTEVDAERLKLSKRALAVEGELQAAYVEQRAEQEKGITLDTAETELRQLAKTGELRRCYLCCRRAASDRWRNRRDSKALRAQLESSTARNAAD